MRKFQILMNSEGYRFGAGLWTVTKHGQGAVLPVWSDNIELLQELSVTCEETWRKSRGDGGDGRGIGRNRDVNKYGEPIVNHLALVSGYKYRVGSHFHDCKVLFEVVGNRQGR